MLSNRFAAKANLPRLVGYALWSMATGSVLPAHAQLQLAAPDVYQGAGNWSVEAEDMDCDGLMDLVVARPDVPESEIVIFYQNENGSFLRYSIPVVDRPFGAAVADFNGDDKPDIASGTRIGSGPDQKLAVFINLGDRQFSSPDLYVAGDGPRWTSAAHLNNDDFADIVVATWFDTSINVFLNNGDGTFAPRVRYPISKTARNMTVGDLNQDGAIDLAMSGLILLNDGAGGFQIQSDLESGGGGFNFSADVNGDERLDIIVTGSVIGVRYNLGGGAFSDPVYLPYNGNLVTGIATGDLDSDRDVDIAALSISGPLEDRNRVHFFAQNDLGEFELAGSFVDDPDPSELESRVLAVSLSGSGIPDLVTVSRPMRVYRNLAGPPPPPPCVGDLNDDREVNGADLALLLNSFGPCNEPLCPADLTGTGDGVVDGSDLATLLNGWGVCPE